MKITILTVGLWITPIIAVCQTAPAARSVVRIDAAESVTAKAGATVAVPLAVHVDEGFHVNSNKPLDEFLIPLRLTWNADVLENGKIDFPQAHTAKLPFSSKAVSIFSGSFKILSSFKVRRDANAGSATITGKLRYQACGDRECLPPKTVDVSFSMDIVK